MTPLHAISTQNFQEMITADSLAKEWLDLALTKPSVIHEIESKSQRYKISRPEEYKFVLLLLVSDTL